MPRKGASHLKQQLKALGKKTRRERLKQPFDCPLCYKAQTVRLEKDRNVFRIYCTRGCFDYTKEYPKTFEQIDVYHQMIDEVSE